MSLDSTAAQTTEVTVPVGDAELDGDLVVPEGATGIVLFAHGSGSGRRSPRNRQVAAALNEGRIGTLLVDLLTQDEERVDRVTGEHRFDIDLLARRVIAAVDWLGRDPAAHLPIGLFGASTGAAAALVAAAERPERIRCVVSRGGRPDLAGDALGKVRAPALLIVGGRDSQVLALNESAATRLGGPNRIVTVPGATHLFEEPGALDQVASLAADWFSRYLRPAPAHRG
jgi:pimeloyl-ACP methyl ester carboxylesterase